MAPLSSSGTAPVVTQGRGAGSGMCLVRGVGWIGWTEAGWAACPCGPRPSGVGGLPFLCFVLFLSFFYVFFYLFNSFVLFYKE